MNALLDANVVLDVLLLREPWLAESRAVWQLCDEGKLDGYLSAVTLTNIFYLGRKVSGNERALAAIRQCVAAFQIAPVARATIEAALALPGHDFEDNVQIACAVESGAERIVTRNIGDFAHAPLPVVTPTQLLVEIDTPAVPDTPTGSTGSA